MNRLPLISGLLLLGLVGVAHAEAPARKLSLQEAIQLALAQNSEAATAKLAVTSAQEHTRGQKAKRYPSVRVDAIGNLYSEPYQLPFGMQVFTLHERLTSISTLTISQPLTGLAYLSELVGAAEHETSARKDEYDRVKLDIAYRTAEAYIRLLEARASAEVAQQSIADIQSGLDRAVQLRQADVYTDIDVLRFRSARAAAEQSSIKARSSTEAAEATLINQLGLPDGAVVEISDDLPAVPPPLAVELAAAQQRAISTRPELRAAHERLAEAGDTRRAARWQYFPDIRAVGVAQYNTGVQPFQPEHEEYLGLRLSWELWDWGARSSSVAEAEQGEQRARIAEGSLANQVRLEVRRRWLDARTAFDSLAAARVQQEAAAEAYRLQKVRFDAAAATTTDVLDAETEVARARLAFALARYDYYLALVGLARSVGDLPAQPH